MVGSYNLLLVFASYCVAVVASFSAIYFGTKVYELSGSSKRFWLVAGAVCLGSGIWSMHFVGMSAYQMPMGMEMSFDAIYTFASWVPALLASWLALYVITLPSVSLKGLVSSSFIMGAGIFTMHYVGMAAMKMTPAIQYDSLLVTLSGVIAIAASAAALFICRKIRDIPDPYSVLAKLFAALTMGIAICGMHYTGMAAASYPMDAQAAASNGLRGDWMGYPAAITAGVFLLFAIYIAYADFRAQECQRKAQADKEKAIEYAAFYDADTGLPNRSLLERIVLDKLRVNDSKREVSPFRLYYFEITDLKDVTQTYGEDCSRTLVKKFAEFLTQQDSIETLSRYSQNGFIAIAPVQQEHRSQSFLQPISNHLQHPLTINGQSVEYRLGVGFSDYPSSGSNSRNLIKLSLRLQHQLSTSKNAA